MIHEGKLPIAVLKRSVLKNVAPEKRLISGGTSVCSDYSRAAILQINDGVFLNSTQTAVLDGRDEDRSVIRGLLHRLMNDLYMAYEQPKTKEVLAQGLSVGLALPEGDFDEKRLKSIMRAIRDEMNQIEPSVAIDGGHTTLSKSIAAPVLSLVLRGVATLNQSDVVSGTASDGSGETSGFSNEKPACANEKQPCTKERAVICTKYIGLEGTARLARRVANKEGELLAQRYRADFIEGAKAFDEWYSLKEDARIAACIAKTQTPVFHNVSEGGIFGALWELCEGLRCAISVDLKAIPIKQETVELCEFFGCNPYTLISTGAMLCAVAIEDAQTLCRVYEEAGIPAVIIGHTNDGNDRVLINEDEKRFLDVPQMDHIFL